MSKLTCDDLAETLRCIIFLVDLLREDYKCVLTARFLTDLLEQMFQQVPNERQRFLVGLREVEASERILTTKNLLKESNLVWNKDVCPHQTKAIVLD